MSLWGGIGSLFGIESSERAKADALRKQALEQAQNQSELTKQMYLDNSEAIDNLGSDLFGADPEKLAQAAANARAASAAQMQGSRSTTTPSGRNAVFDFGQAVAQQPASGATSLGSAPNAQQQQQQLETYYDETGHQYQVPVGSTQTVADGNGGVKQVSAPDWLTQQIQAKNAAPTTSAPTNAAITDADRAAAAKQIQSNYGNTLPGQLDASFANRKSAIDTFVNDLNGIKSVDAGNYDNSWNVDPNKAYISDATRAAQQTAMDKTLALTDTKETAQEKLMREMARREQEQTLRSEKEAQASQLRARGAYGSGAELAGFLGSQQEAAQRRSLEEMQANANAQQRSISALGQYGNLAMQQGQQDTTVGGLQDLNSRFNSQSQQQFNQFKTKTQQAENDALAKRSASKADAVNTLENTKRADINSIADRKTQLTGMKTGNNTNLVGASGQASSNLAGAYNNAAASADAKGDKDEDLLGGIL